MMLEIGFKEEEICKPGRRSFHPMKELHSMVEAKIQELQKDQATQIQSELEKRLAAPPPLHPPTNQ